MIITFLEIAVIAVLFNESGFVVNIERYLSNKLYGGRLTVNFGKLLHCSLCQCWWASLIAMLVMGEFSLFNIMLALLVAYSTNIITDVLHLLLDICTKITDCISKLFRL